MYTTLWLLLSFIDPLLSNAVKSLLLLTLEPTDTDRFQCAAGESAT